jgi:hypothetical protein
LKAIKSNPKDKNRGIKTGIILVLVTCSLFATLYGVNSEAELVSTRINEVQKAVKRSAGYLAKATRENGKFEYRINMDPAVKVEDEYNILRHAGAIYAMCLYQERYPDKKMRSAIERAGNYLKNESIYPIMGHQDVLAIWSKPEVNRSNNPLQAKLGGTGLGLLALLCIENVHPGFTPLSDLQALGQFLVYMQKQDGSFYSMYIPSMGGRRDEWQSLYYPGEAALGLLMLYQKDPSDVWFESAVKALAYLARHPRAGSNLPPDHWALLATSKLLSLAARDKLPVPRKLLIGRAIQICNTILESQAKSRRNPVYDGSFSKVGRTMPTATRLEGLLATLAFLPPENDEERKRIEIAVPHAIDFLLRAQVKEGRFAGAFPGVIRKINPRIPNAEKFNRKATEVMIDYVQHALSAMLGYLDKEHGS